MQKKKTGGTGTFRSGKFTRCHVFLARPGLYRRDRLSKTFPEFCDRWHTTRVRVRGSNCRHCWNMCYLLSRAPWLSDLSGTISFPLKRLMWHFWFLFWQWKEWRIFASFKTQRCQNEMKERNKGKGENRVKLHIRRFQFWGSTFY